jgi:hypothetical protein
VLKLYYYARWGNVHTVVRLYHPRVRAAMGRQRIAAVYSENRGAFLAREPEVLETRRTRDGVFVAVRLRHDEGKASSESYLLRRRKTGWLIAHDTLFERAVGEFGQRATDGGRRSVSRQGRRAALRASRDFRNLFLPRAGG